VRHDSSGGTDAAGVKGHQRCRKKDITIAIN
jgi:hypothetical protein